VSVGVAYDSPADKVTELIAQATAEHPHIVKEPEPDVLLEDFGENALLFTVQFWMRLCPGVDGGTVRSELRHRISGLFHHAGINMAFPQRDVHLDCSGPIEVRVSNGQSLLPKRVHHPRSECSAEKMH
jgi:potassium-dependent mechanosensitive channel